MSPYLNKQDADFDLQSLDHFLVGKYKIGYTLAYVVLPRCTKLSILGM
jgi:hypothetical protein